MYFNYDWEVFVILHRDLMKVSLGHDNLHNDVLAAPYMPAYQLRGENIHNCMLFGTYIENM